MTPQTLYDRLWDSHPVHVEDDGTTVHYIDRNPSDRNSEGRQETGGRTRLASPEMAAAAAIAGHFVDVCSWH